MSSDDTPLDLVEKLKQLKPCTFRYDSSLVAKDERIRIGFIAEDVEKLFPKDTYGVVGYNKDSPSGVLGIDYTNFVPMLVKTCQVLMERVETLEAEVKTLKENK